MARQLQELRERLELRNVRCAQERVRLCLTLRADRGGTVALPGLLQDIAADIGLTREVLYRAWPRFSGGASSGAAGAASASNRASAHDRSHMGDQAAGVRTGDMKREEAAMKPGFFAIVSILLALAGPVLAQETRRSLHAGLETLDAERHARRVPRR